MGNIIIKKRYLTLMEMLIVMFIIASLIGVLAYNYMGSLDESRAFKSKVAIERLTTFLNLKAAEDPEFLNNVESRWREVITKSPLVQNPKDLLKDGWGGDYEVYVEEGVIKVRSRRYEEYQRTHQSMFNQ